jgi:hypothetical protein
MAPRQWVKGRVAKNGTKLLGCGAYQKVGGGKLGSNSTKDGVLGGFSHSLGLKIDALQYNLGLPHRQSQACRAIAAARIEHAGVGG